MSLPSTGSYQPLTETRQESPLTNSVNSNFSSAIQSAANPIQPTDSNHSINPTSQPQPSPTHSMPPSPPIYVHDDVELLNRSEWSDKESQKSSQQRARSVRTVGFYPVIISISLFLFHCSFSLRLIFICSVPIPIYGVSIC